jgi:hypothetical protein
MIHEVRLPRHTKIYLWQITRLQMNVLSCATTLQHDFTEQNLQTALTGKMRQRAECVAECICKRKDTRVGLQTFVSGSLQERQSLVESMRRDVLRLVWAQRNETLECRFADDRQLPYFQKGAKQFLLAFYEQLSSGISADTLRFNPANYPKYGREQYFKDYESENPHQSVCTICDEHRPITIIHNDAFSDIEHYFPKSIYPHLACHPYNLIPICKACNSAHRNRDPLNGQNGAWRTLGEVFLPYRRESVRLHGAVKLDWTQPVSPALSIVKRKDDANNLFHARLMAFSEIYDIPGRWQNRIHQIGEQLWRQMSYFIRAEIEKDEELDVFMVKTALERLLNYFIEDLGATPWDYVLVWYLSHLLVTEIEATIQNHQPQNEVALIQTLDEMIKESLLPVHPVLRADEVLETSRSLYKA